MKQFYTSGLEPSRTVSGQWTAMGRRLLMMLLFFAFVGGVKASVNLPYTCGFESGDEYGEWIISNTSEGTGLYQDADQAHGGTNFVGFYYDEQNGAFISPVLVGGDDGVAVSFWYKEYSSDYGDEQFQVGYATDENATNPTAFTYGPVITASTDWQQYQNTFPAGTKRIAVKYIYNDCLYLFLDDFSFEAATYAPDPSDPTPVSSVELPYEYGFESIDLAADGWTAVVSSSNSGIKGNAKRSGSFGFVFNYSENPGYLVSPLLTGGGNYTIEVSFWYKEYSADYGDEQFQVGYTTDEDVTNPAAFTYGDVITASTEWQQYQETFPAGTKRIAIKYIYGDHWYLYFDDFVFDVNDGFAKPADLAASEITTNSVQLSWTEQGTATAWLVAYKTGDADFTEVNSTENPFTLTGLTPDTEYTVKVRPAGETNKWSAEITFTTEATFPAPTDLAANNVMGTTADIAWTGNDEATSYNLQYRVAPGMLTTDFEDSAMGEWTTIDADGDGNDWVLGSACGGIYLSEGGSLAGEGHNDSQDFMTSGSYSNVSGALHPDNYLVSPLTTLGGSISFYAWAQDVTYPAEHFGVAVSTTSNDDPAAFTTIQEWTMTALGATFTVDLSAYEGQTGYVAIRHFNCSDQFLLNIDDIVIEMPETAAGSWIEANNVTSPYTITELTPGTRYNVEVQAVYEGGNSKWASTTFSTLDPDVAPFNLQTADVTAINATLNWDGVQDSYNVRYRKNPVYYFNSFNTDEELAEWYYSMAISGMNDPVYNISSDNNFVLSMGWNKTDEDYIISPELPAYPSGSTLEFYHSYYKEENTFQIGYATTFPNNIDEDFTWSEPISTVSISDTYSNKFSQELPDGVKYIAFKATASDRDHSIFIDDLKITDYDSIDEWEETISDVDDTTLDISFLTPNTNYEWQVQGIYNSEPTEWSESAFFTTGDILELADDAIGNSDIIGTYEGQTFNVKLAGRTLYKDGKWNTICLPFEVDLEGSVLQGAIARELTSTEITGNGEPEATTLNLNFSETVSTLEAGKPYIIRWTTGEDIENPVFEDVTLDATENFFESGSGETRVSFLGNYDAISFTDEDSESILLMGGSNTLYYANANAGLGACRAYFEIGEGGNAVRVTSFIMNFGDTTTGIRSIENVQTMDGNDAWYTLDGRKLNGKPSMKGVYINKGNRIIIK